MPGKLSTYHAKRNFQLTPEPRGELAAPGEHLRFVVQEHHARRLHYDFRLELDGTLKSWAVPKGPSLDPAEKRLAVHVEDHPLDYIDFEGDIPEHQYGAGHVDVWDSGWWEPEGDPLAAYEAGKLKFRLHGDKLHGGWALVRTHLAARGGKEQWLLIKEKDDSARSGEHIETSSHTENATALPDTMKPQLATLAEALPTSGDWIYEIKFDGYRILARVSGDDVRLFTRDGEDWTAKLRKQADAIRSLGLQNAWLDGEIVVLDKHGVPSFQQLQRAFERNGNAHILYYLFDLPWLHGHDLRPLPLRERRALLEQVMTGVPPDILRYSAPLHEPPQQLLDSACQMEMEGLIGKRTDAPYVGRRSDTWIKLKCRQRQEFVIVGYTEPQGSRKFFGALLLGVHEDDTQRGKLRYCGRVGTGFDRASLHAVHAKLKTLQQADCPFDRMPAGMRKSGTHWVKPQLVAEISFAEWTGDGMLRQAVFHGLREDKPAQEIRREHAIRAMPRTQDDRIEGVAITHPERIIDTSSGLTKLDLAHYYADIAPHILPWLKQRPVYLLRCPEGIDGEHFFQKHRTHMNMPGVGTFDPALDPGHAPLMEIASAQALAGAAQMGMVELHTCNATADRIDRPDYLVFDLDPDPALPWKTVVEGTKLTKVALDELGLRSFLKTSGGKGMHLVVPLARHHGWDEAAAFSQAVAQHLARTLPKLFSAKMGEQNRVGKIFVDYLRNRRQASTVAPWSARARPGLPVSTPIAWEELDTLDSAAQWTITSVPQRLAQLQGDPWRDFFTLRQRLTATMMKKLGVMKK